MKFLIAVLFVFPVLCFASTEKLTLHELMKHSDVAGVLTVETYKVLDSGKIILKGRASSVFKGEMASVTVVVPKASDADADAKKYFFIGNCNSYVKKGGVCSVVSSRIGVQTIFPFDEGGEHILASRESFLTTRDGSFYMPDSYVDAFLVKHGRIFAFVKWSAIVEAVKSEVEGR
ncbi:hypothetical protein [Gallaecimonas pentaromativorans]|uniref:Uncharacterized protein n=1 Tax=Gallaecimonas pentaromativorans TaxID=584787 RepID=A0A3N1P9D6_9GAMM|nr:hypothetical protein [Gallaecimonas pentaromativorans]ROQ24338.1 hypothetical protein EDC28_107221 [Gallaecimonas pentaromativorans]